MKINNIKSMRNYLYANSGFTKKTVNNVINALGYPLNGSGHEFNDLSSQFQNCAEHGANVGFCGFIYYSETIAFFKENKNDIVNHMENTALELGEDIISMIQGFGIFRNSEKPTPSEIGKALWGNGKSSEHTTLYNVFAWYALEEVSYTWFRYLEEHPTYKMELAA